MLSKIGSKNVSHLKILLARKLLAPDIFNITNNEYSLNIRLDFAFILKKLSLGEGNWLSTEKGS